MKIYGFFFIENKIIQKDKYIEGNYIAGNEKLFLSFTINYKNYYEIGYFDSNNNFIIEYLIQEYSQNCKNDIISLFSQGIDFFMKNNFKNEIKSNSNQIICYCYKIKQNDNNDNDDNNIIISNLHVNEDEQFIIEIIKILISIFSFEKEIKTKIEESKQKNSYITDICYIINVDLLIRIKKLFPYEHLSKFMNDLKIQPNSDINNIILNEIKSKDNRILNLI